MKDLTATCGGFKTEVEGPKNAENDVIAGRLMDDSVQEVRSGCRRCPNISPLPMSAV